MKRDFVYLGVIGFLIVLMLSSVSMYQEDINELEHENEILAHAVDSMYDLGIRDEVNAEEFVRKYIEKLRGP